MDSLLKFKLEVEEMLSGAVKKAGSVTHSVFEGIDGTVKRTQGYLNDLGNEIKMKVNTSELDHAHEKIEKMRESAHVFVELLAERGVEKGLEFMKEQVGEVLMGGMEASKTEAQIKVMAGDEEGEQLYKDTHAYIPTSMFGPELFQQEKVLLGMGEHASNIMTDIKQLADISMGDRQHMESIALAEGETISGGKFTAMQQRILRPTGFNPIAELSRSTGKSVEYLTQKMADGEFSVNMFRQAMEAAVSPGGRFFEMQKKISETPFGKKQIMETNIDMAKEELGVALLPAEGALLDKLKPIIDTLPEELQKLQPAMEGLIQDFGDLVKWVSNNTEVIGNWFNVLKVGAEIYIGYKTITMGAGMAMNLYAAATKGAAIVNGLFGVSETIATGAVTKQGIAVTVAASDYAYYTTATAEATVATEELDAALMATPWGIIAAGIGLVAGAYLLMRDNSKNTNDALSEDVSLTQDEKDRRERELEEWSKKQREKHGAVTVSGLGIVPDYSYNKEDDDAAYEKEHPKKEPAKLKTNDTETITGGGARVNNFNFRNFVETINNYANGKGEAINYNERDLKAMLARILSGAPN